MPERSFQTATAVVPIYNEEARLERCLRSLTMQGAPLAQIVLVNDGSRDGSAAIIDGFAKADPRVEVVTHAENAGLARTLNDGIARARGDSVLILQADCELIGDDWIERALERLGQDAPCCIVGSPVYPIDEMGTTEAAVGLLRDHFAQPLLVEDVSFSEFKCDLLPREALDRLRFDPTFRISGEDQVLSHRLHEEGYRLLRHRDLAYIQRYGNWSTLRPILRRESVYGKGEAGALMRTGFGIASQSAGSAMGRGRLRNRGFAVLDTLGWAALVVVLAAQGLSVLLIFPAALILTRAVDVALRRRSADARYRIPTWVVGRAVAIAPLADVVYTFGMVAGFVSYFAAREV